MRVRRDVGLPEILQIVIVCCRSSPFNLGQDASLRSQSKEEVRSCPGHQAVLWRQHNLLGKPKLIAQEKRELCLYCLTLGAVNVRSRDDVGGVLNVSKQSLGEVVNPQKF